MSDSFVPLRCQSETLAALETGLVGFAVVEGPPLWLTSAVWLCTKMQNFVATAAIEVLGDGFLARPLAIDTPAALSDQVLADLPDIEGRLIGHGDFKLPAIADMGEPSASSTRWLLNPPACSILVRATRRASATHHVACALLFRGVDHAVLIGTDPSTLALVFSETEEMIEAYGRGCEQLSVPDYRRRCL